MKKSMYRAWRLARNGRTARGLSGGQSAPAAQPAGQPGWWTGRTWLVLLLCLLGSTAASFVAFKFVVPVLLAPTVPHELIGTWQVTEGGLQGATLEFTWWGTSTAVLNNKGKQEVTKSTVQVIGKKIILTSNNTAGVQERYTQTILQLTPDELVIRDEDGHVYKMKRVAG
jgi:uncharacterized protein (TIGR03066 family)